jgi:hypothetical protein
MNFLLGYFVCPYCGGVFGMASLIDPQLLLMTEAYDDQR